MPAIKIKSLSFNTPPFRKLGNLTINFADRLTLIAGHNGIGKSTILGLVSNGSGIRDASFQTYLNRGFYQSLNEIIHIDHAREFEEPKGKGIPLPSPLIQYEIDGKILTKCCSLTERGDRHEVRVVSRNDPLQDFCDDSGAVLVGRDAKVPLPTIYLGMTRMLPVGESNPDMVTNTLDKDIAPEDASFIQQFISSVIGTGIQSAINTITTQGIKGVKKSAKHPDYAHSPKCISLGQDSLSAIASALASFQKIKREQPDYPGGLLVIDEIDAGFHPHAQKKLASSLTNAARKLGLQIVATTHSACFIETIHPDVNPVGPRGKHIDSVVYLTNSTNPSVANGYSLVEIQRDMSLTLPPPVETAKRKTIKVYLEDPEAHYFLVRLLTRKLKSRIKRESGVSLKSIPLSVGCENLKGLHKHDPYFSTVLIVLDADSSITGTRKGTQNIVKLPGGKDASGRGLSPERTLHAFIQELSKASGKYQTARTALAESRINSDYLRNYLLDGDYNINDRESSKKWMNARLTYLTDWQMAELWIQEHPEEVKQFEDEIVKAAVITAKLEFK